MPIDERKANWRFDALWAFPLHMAGSTDFKKYPQDTYKIPQKYMQIPTKTLRVNIHIRRYQPCRYNQVLHVLVGIM